MFNEQRIPTLIGIAILLIGLTAGIFLLENSNFTLLGKASGATMPYEVMVSNITSDSFTVSWLTTQATTGVLKINSQTAFDSRDTTTPAPYSTHYVEVSGLNPQTTYTFSILSGNNTYQTGEYQATTGPALSTPSHTLTPAFGTLLTSQNQGVKDALVYLSFTDSQLLSTLTNNLGEWVIPLGNIRSKSLTNYFLLRETDQEKLIFATVSGKSTVTVSRANDAPVPPVKLGESYDFSNQQSRKTSGVIMAQSQSFGKLTGTVNTVFRVSMPKNNSAIPSGKPAFSGTGVPDKPVIITVSESPKPVSVTVIIDNNGNWSWSPTLPFSPGKHTATFTSYNSNNSLQATSVSFTILKSGTSVLGEATPSASISPLPSPIIPSPSLQPSASATSSATPSATPPVSGSFDTTIALILIGTSFSLFGYLALSSKLSRQ